LPPQQQQGMAASLISNLGALGGLAGAATGLKNPADQYVSFLKSNRIKDSLIKRFELMNRYDADHIQSARLALDSSVKIINGKDGIISISVDDYDALFAANMSNAHVEELKKLMIILAVTEAQQRRQFFEQQMEQSKFKLTLSEIALRETGVSASILKSSPSAAIAAVAGLQAQITLQEVKIGAMRGYLANSAPDFKQAMIELSSLRIQLGKQSESVSAVGSNGQSLGADYINRYREFKYQETLFELFAKQFEMAKLDEAREGATIQVIDAAEASKLKSAPKKQLITMLATLASGFGLLLFVFVRQAMCNAGKNPESSERWTEIHTSWRKAIGAK
jgi:capsule polysaccharide export protein KpsE/RkpR